MRNRLPGLVRQKPGWVNFLALLRRWAAVRARCGLWRPSRRMYKDFAEGEAAPALEEEGCCSPRQRWCRRL